VSATLLSCRGTSLPMSLSDHPHYPYPRDPVTRFGFVVGDLIAWSIIILIATIALKSTFHF